ncbi:MAG: choice-of-anchor L domain-containing protein [Bacteroidales bacterium]|nr:choice-of-anchor L domain-containing protein [Bacteroidales bacterium]MCF8402328.1 choice-of-anchor L domain-containing protein [Bacteroidales bacterium]
MKKKFTIFILLIIGLALVINQSCKKNEEEDPNNNNPNLTDEIPPQIGVTSPTADFSFLAPGNTVSIAGYASDNETINKVMWTSSNGQNGTASGTTSWGITDVTLTNGDNLFTFIAYDGASNTDTATLLVTYNEFFTFSGQLAIDPPGFFVNVNTNVKFQIPVLNNPNLVANSIKLIEVDMQGNLVEEIGEMFDDGDLAHGDDIQGDGVYSLFHTFMETVPSRILLRVRVTTEENTGQVFSYSEIGDVMAVDQIPETAMMNMLNVQNLADQKFQQVFASSGYDEALAQTITFLEESSEVLAAGQTESGDIWIDFNYGLAGMVLATDEENEGGSGDDKNSRYSKPPIPIEKQTVGTPGPSYYNTKEGEHTVLDNDVMLFAPNWVEFNSWGTEFLDGLNTLLTGSTCPSFDVSYLKNEAADLHALRTLSEYGLIVIHTHGGLDKDNNVIFLTGDEATYEVDEILEWIFGNIMPIPFKGKTMWAVKPGFISTHNNNYPNSIIYNGSCESAHNTTMSNAFINKGANTYFGFSETVKSWFDRDMANQLFPKLISQGKTTGEAFVGNQHDNNNPPAYFVMWGDNQTKFASDFVNGDFEEGNLNGWNVVGDGRVITQLGPITPFDSLYMGIISTGLGFTVDVGSLSQDFCVPDTATTLSLQWNFLSEEFLEWVGSQYQDYFEISIIDNAGNKNVLFYKTIDNVYAEYELTLVSPDIVFDQGDVYGTGWQFVSFDISAYAGQDVTLVLGAGDVGDSIYDTAILLDNIKVE